MSNPVNPPPQLRIPDAFQEDRQVFGYIKQLNQILFQLYTRTGGSEDEVSNSLNQFIPMSTAQINALQLQLGSGDDLTADTTSFTADSTLFSADMTEA